jgi:hypothetical protein
MPFVSITRLRVRSWRYLPAFLFQTLRAARQAKAASGSLAVATLRDADLAFWTRTVWTEEAAMRSFMVSGAHRTVMPRLLEWCDEASVVHWVQDAPEPRPGPSHIGEYSRRAGARRSIILRRRSVGSRFRRRKERQS